MTKRTKALSLGAGVIFLLALAGTAFARTTFDFVERYCSRVYGGSIGGFCEMIERLDTLNASIDEGISVEVTNFPNSPTTNPTEYDYHCMEYNPDLNKPPDDSVNIFLNARLADGWRVIDFERLWNNTPADICFILER